MPALTRLTRPAGLLATLLASLASLAPCGVLAQVSYKVVTPDGKVTYTDRPVVAQPGMQVQPLRRDAISADAGGLALPLELRALQARFPVLLYTSTDCPACDSGRRLLQLRGVPYGERLVTTDEDAAALQRLSGSRGVPVLMVGGQALRGFLDSDWQATLDLAGYPKESRLPRGWQAPPATPLVAQPTAPSPASAEAARPSGEPAFPQASSDPSGIRF